MPVELQLKNLDWSAIVHPGETVAWGQATAEPATLTRHLMAQRHAIGAFNVFLGASYGGTVTPEHADAIQFSSYCGTGDNRRLSARGLLDILPLHYSELPKAIQQRRLPIDVLVLQVAPADGDGAYSLSLTHDYLMSAIDSARVVIAEVNDRTPWTHGSRALTAADIDYIVHASSSPIETPVAHLGDIERAIGQHIAELVENGATLQIGIGSIPDAVLSCLANHAELGVHSGLFSDGVARLMSAGVVTNARKAIDAGVTVANTVFGSRYACEFVDRNAAVQFRPPGYTHSREVLSRLERFVAINSAIEVDLTGQVNAEIANGVYVGAVGGAVDFVRAAHRSAGGLPIIALPSRHGSSSRIVSRLSGPVTIPRSDAGIIVTEHGIADLRQLSLARRREAMIAIAHPDFRGKLRAEISD